MSTQLLTASDIKEKMIKYIKNIMLRRSVAYMIESYPLVRGRSEIYPVGEPWTLYRKDMTDFHRTVQNNVLSASLNKQTNSNK